MAFQPTAPLPPFAPPPPPPAGLADPNAAAMVPVETPSGAIMPNTMGPPRASQPGGPDVIMMQGPSPSKDDLKAQIGAMAAQAERDTNMQKAQMQHLEAEANEAMKRQNADFQSAANQYKSQYEAKAEEMSQTIKKMAQVEIDQSKARTQMQFSGVDGRV